ncbi:hypothetical protein HWV62_25741 [Athelia sp. TMB]|nr:hypothetical protein HWV62_25741 [Athelia sp. TMB]
MSDKIKFKTQTAQFAYLDTETPTVHQETLSARSTRNLKLAADLTRRSPTRRTAAATNYYASPETPGDAKGAPTDSQIPLQTTHPMATPEELAAFIARHRTLLARERDAEIERSALLLSNCGPRLLEQKGLALLGLGVVSVNIGLGGKTLIELERPAAYHTSAVFPPHTIRPGDLARIEENGGTGTAKKPAKPKKADAAAAAAAEGVVYKVSPPSSTTTGTATERWREVTDTRITLALEPADDDAGLPERCRVVKLANSVTYDRMEKALDHLEKTVLPGAEKPPQEITPLIRVLLGLAAPSAPAPMGDIAFFDPSLNDSQKDAVRFALAAPEVACIHGPPGTGKTHTLIELIRQLTTPTPSNPRAQRVLVCGASNLAVDNILERLLALPGEKMRATRVGHPARVLGAAGVLDATLDAQAARSDQAALARDVKAELEATLATLSGKGKGKGKPPRGAERRKMWDEVKALRKEYRQREGGVVQAVLGASQVRPIPSPSPPLPLPLHRSRLMGVGQIVLATCHAAGGRQLRGAAFDVAIIDEATQALEAVCWIPVFKAAKLVLAGDPMQLPPTVLSLGKRKYEKRAAGEPVEDSEESEESEDDEWLVGDTMLAQDDPEPVPDLPTKTKATDAVAPAVEEECESLVGQDGAEPAPDPPRETAPAKDPKKDLKKNGSRLRPPRTLETTLFDRLARMHGACVKRMLTVQYRMHAQICAFPSAALYGARLAPDASAAGRLLRDLPDTAGDDDVLGAPVVFFDTAGCEYFERAEGDGDGGEGSRCNENEAGVVGRWVATLVANGVLPGQIAVITPYQAQVTLLAGLLRPLHGPALEIGTVDGMQGREKDAVVISLVRSNDKREVGFLREKRRLNVAMTRAKRSLCVVGDSSTVQHGGAFLAKWLAWLEAHADVRYAGEE